MIWIYYICLFLVQTKRTFLVNCLHNFYFFKKYFFSSNLQQQQKLLWRGGGPLVITHKFRFISWLILAPRPPMHFHHITFPGTIDKISHCPKFHISSCLISWLSKYDLWETTECSPPLPNLISKLALCKTRCLANIECFDWLEAKSGQCSVMYWVFCLQRLTEAITNRWLNPTTRVGKNIIIGEKPFLLNVFLSTSMINTLHWIKILG